MSSSSVAVASSKEATRQAISAISQSKACRRKIRPTRMFAGGPKIAYALDLTTVAKPGLRNSLVVEPGNPVQQAIDALPVSGGEITVKPGTYREVVTIRKPNVHLHGQDPDPSKTTIVFNNGPANGGTFASGTVYVEAPNVTIDHLTIANDLGNGKGQGVALAVTADRAIFRNLRILGAQDTLFAASRYCYGDYGPCEPRPPILRR